VVINYINKYLLQQIQTKLKTLQEQKMRGRRREEGGEEKGRVLSTPLGVKIMRRRVWYL
jgi:plasmid stabilization system protein ParE